MRDAELAFQPGWPALQQGRGEVLVEDSGVRVRLAEGRILDSRVHDVTAEVAHVGSGQVPQLAIKGQVSSSLPDALRLLQEAPIGTGETFAGWKGQGELDGALDLQIPLGKGTPRVVVDFASSDAALQITEPALAFERLSGRFRYDTARGLSADEIQARLFGRAVNGKAVATGSVGKPASRIEARGSVALKPLLEWLDVKQPVPASGELPYQLRLELAAESSQLQIDSSLQGLRIDLPAPFGKAAGVRRDSTLRMSLLGAERRYSVRHDELAALVFVAPLMPGRRDAASCAWVAVRRIYRGDPGCTSRGACRSWTGMPGVPCLISMARATRSRRPARCCGRCRSISIVSRASAPVSTGWASTCNAVLLPGPSACAVPSSAARCVCRTPMTASS